MALVLPIPADSIATPFSSDFTMDVRAYVTLGGALERDGQFAFGPRPTAFRPPLYPAYLALVESLFGSPSYRAARIGQAILGAVAATALFGTGLVLFGPLAGLAAGLGLAFYPFVVYFTGELMTETLYITLGTLSLLFVALLMTRPRGWHAVACGVLLGLAVLCRPTAAFWVIGIAAAAVVAALKGDRIAALRWLAVVSIAAAVTLPWLVRNSLVFGQPVFVTTYTGLNLYKGLPGKDDRTSAVDLGYYQHMVEDPKVTSLPAPEPELDRRALRYWTQFVLREPAAYVGEKLRDLRRFWFDLNLAGALGRSSGWLRAGAVLCYLVALALAATELLSLWRRPDTRRAVVLPLAVIAIAMAAHVPFFAGKRFRVASVDPVLVLLAGAFLAEIARRRGWFRRLVREPESPATTAAAMRLGSE
jgi:4-amino-4-deoxy-L-arabinose transferase-like glycosyltransferase